ncbi:hypothetical protein [Xanthobacter flavus]|uniref:hypothetical protein n=1 Tax=Xanthobacter flavus TaxID=281 RepID=UPI001AEAA13E|nr:hypothetical protein [Xanthobacter flavus]MBP2148298.1 hypothetical protein [Xanthobacter flavus]
MKPGDAVGMPAELRRMQREVGPGGTRGMAPRRHFILSAPFTRRILELIAERHGLPFPH